ncbi:MAG: anti-sigma factor [Gemmatimonadota bacterium]
MSPSDLAAAYALGALDPAEAVAFERLLADSAELQREVAEYREVNALLALGAGNATPSVGLRARVLQRIAGAPVVSIDAGRRAAPPTGLWLALAASLVAALGLGLTVMSQRRDINARDAALAGMQTQLVASESQLAAREATLNAILDPGVQLNNLTSTNNPEPRIQLFYNPAKRSAIVHAFHLKPTGPGRAYQLWFIPKGGKPIPSVVFNSEPDGHALVQKIDVPAGLELTNAAITEEPSSGSAQPTSAVLLVGPMQKS